MAAHYGKPHLTFDEQLDLLIGRGIVCSDRSAAVAALERIGYYRFSGYVYPFREMLPPSERGLASPTHFRAEAIRPGTQFGDVLAVWRFDRILRLLILDAIETIEIGVRTRLAYTLGFRDPFGHLDPAHLGDRATEPAAPRARPVRATRAGSTTIEQTSKPTFMTTIFATTSTNTTSFRSGLRSRR